MIENNKKKTKYLVLWTLILIVLFSGVYFTYQYVNEKLESEKCEKCEECNKDEAFGESTIVNISAAMYLDSESKTYIKHLHDFNKLVVGEYINGVNELEGLNEFGCISSDKTDDCLVTEIVLFVYDGENQFVLIIDDNQDIYKINLNDYLFIEKKSNYKSEKYNNKKVNNIYFSSSCGFGSEFSGEFNCDESYNLKITYTDGKTENIGTGYSF